jgi:probable F420-dependent oxidoreductase
MASVTVERTRQRLGPVGVFGVARLAGVPLAEELRYVTTLDRLGYGSFWVGEGIGGKDVFVRQGIVLAHTERLAVGTGIANIEVRHPWTARAAATTLAEAHPERFVLGLGAGHGFQTARLGRPYRPLRRMRGYLAEMDGGISDGLAELPSPDVAYPRVLAAVGPKMLELAAELTDGAHPFVQPVDHTAMAREILGPDKLLIPQQPVLLTSDRSEGLAAAAAKLALIAQVPAYAAGYRRLGYSDDDITGAAPKLVEAVYAVGDEETIAARVRDHLAAGADHVLVTPIVDSVEESLTQLERLAPVLLQAPARRG